MSKVSSATRYVSASSRCCILSNQWKIKEINPILYAILYVTLTRYDCISTCYALLELYRCYALEFIIWRYLIYCLRESMKIVCSRLHDFCIFSLQKYIYSTQFLICYTIYTQNKNKSNNNKTVVCVFIRHYK